MLFASGLFLLGDSRSMREAVAVPRAQQQSSTQARLLAALRGNRLPLTMNNGPAGRGWDWLIQEARGASFTLIGQEQGVAETARLSAALFSALRSAGYSRMAIELSPVIAQDVEAAARRNGVQGIAEFFDIPTTWSPMHMREEAQFLATVIAAVPRNERVLWGFDREIFSDRYLISKLEAKVPRSAREPFTRLKQASMDAWAKYQREPNGDNLFLLSQEPAVVSALRTAWPNPDRDSAEILRTLEESLAIETGERTGGVWPFMERRTQWMRSNVAQRLREERAHGSPAKVMLRGGYNKMIRGANYFNMFDVGSMVDEAAALNGSRAFHILVLPGPGSRQAVFGPGRSFVSVSSDEFDEFRAGDQRLTRVLSNADATGHEVIDLRALRPLAMRGLEGWNADVVRTIHGYDAAVIWKGAHASTS
jgi:hypothetical protein